MMEDAVRDLFNDTRQWVKVLNNLNVEVTLSMVAAFMAGGIQVYARERGHKNQKKAMESMIDLSKAMALYAPEDDIIRCAFHRCQPGLF